MADYMIKGETLTNIANAIRAKSGSSATMTPEQMSTEIENISAGGGDNYFAQYVEGNITELTADMLAGVSKIRTNAFSNVTILTSVVIPSNVKTISGGAFYNCTNLTSVVINEGVESLGNSDGSLTDKVRTFGNTSIQNIVIPNSVKYIGVWCFNKCTDLQSVDIGSGITEMTKTFSGCTALQSITCRAVVPPTADSDTFTSVPEDCAIYVPAESVEAYQSATNWSARASYIQAIVE